MGSLLTHWKLSATQLAKISLTGVGLSFSVGAFSSINSPNKDNLVYAPKYEGASITITRQPANPYYEQIASKREVVSKDSIKNQYLAYKSKEYSCPKSSPKPCVISIKAHFEYLNLSNIKFSKENKQAISRTMKYTILRTDIKN